MSRRRPNDGVPQGAPPLPVGEHSKSTPLRTTPSRSSKGRPWFTNVVIIVAAGLSVFLTMKSPIISSPSPSGPSSVRGSRGSPISTDADTSSSKQVAKAKSKVDEALKAASKPKSSANAKRKVAVETDKTTLRIYHSSKECKGNDFTSYYTSTIEGPDGAETDYVTLKIPKVEANEGDKSMQIIGPGEVRLYNGQNNYVATVVEMEGCNPMFPWPPIKKGKLFHKKVDPETQAASCQIDKELQKKFATTDDLSQPHTRVVYSAESSDYFGYQTFSNAYAFLDTKQTKSSWLRLLTSEEPDDLAERFPTFTAPRSPYSKRYGPINKPDVIEKWLNSCDAPHPDDTIVVIDPDNFLMMDLVKWTSDVSRKKALGQAAYYIRSPTVQKMWREVCEANCDKNVDEVGVPYVVKAADLKDIAPLWRYYTMKVKELVQTDEQFKEKYEKPLNVMWAAEMFGYNFASTHLSIETKIVHDMQARDVDASIPLDTKNPKGMIHMGRAWFPKQHQKAAGRWRHTEGKDFLDNNYRAVQVFCKCNATASTIIPWPIPAEGLDWQSFHTLRVMHDGIEYFGGVPVNETFRHKPPEGYYWTKN